MNRFIRILVAWIVAVALPAHAYALLSLPLCGGPSATRTFASGNPTGSHETHRHAGVALNPYGVDAGTDAGASQGINDAGDHDSAADAATDSGFCGLAVFLPMDFSRRLGPVPVQSTRFRVEAVRNSVVAPERLDRPPRLDA